MFSSPQVNLYSADVERSVAFYERLGLTESFRTPLEGGPIHVELRLDGFILGVAAASSSAVADHGLDVSPGGRAIEICVWTDDCDAAYVYLLDSGATSFSETHDWLENLRVGRVTDPDDNPVELVQRRT